MPRVIGHQVGPLPKGRGPLASTAQRAFKWDPSLGVQEGPTCEYLYAQVQGPVLEGTWKVLEGTREY